MRYYSVILININAGLIEIWDIGTPCTKRGAQRYAKNQAFAKIALSYVQQKPRKSQTEKPWRNSILKI